jgi:hypothetical protein
MRVNNAVPNNSFERSANSAALIENLRVSTRNEPYIRAYLAYAVGSSVIMERLCEEAVNIQ